MTLTDSAVTEFKEAVDQQVEIVLSISSREMWSVAITFFIFFSRVFTTQYWYELFLDDLPMWGMVGEALRDSTGVMENVSHNLYPNFSPSKRKFI